MSLAFIALLLIMGMSASASRMGMSRHASVADSDSAKLEAVNDSQSIDPGSIVDEVIWVVGDEAILKSDVEVTRLQSEADGIKFVGDPDCSIPEQIAVQKLFLHQAAIDSIEVSESEVMQGIDDQINYWVSMIGSREKLEEYRKQAESDAEADSSIDVEERLAEYIADEAEAYTGERMTAEEYGKWILENSTESAIGEAFKEAMLKDVTVSDEEIKSWYDENLKTQQETYDNNPENYKADKEAEELYGGDPVLYVPEGYSRVLHILITPEDAISDEYSEKFSEMEDLKSEYGELAFTVNVEGGEGADRLSEIKTEYNKLKADADKIKDEYLAPSVEKAKEAYAKLQSGEEFSKVAKEYSPDTEGNKNGLLISVKHSGSYDWSKEVKDAFAKIKQGEYTEPVKDDEGVHILYYLSDEPAGEVGLDSVKDKIKEILMIDVQEDEWNQMLETWKNDESVSLNEELVRSVTYSPAAVG